MVRMLWRPFPCYKASFRNVRDRSFKSGGFPFVSRYFRFSALAGIARRTSWWLKARRNYGRLLVFNLNSALDPDGSRFGRMFPLAGCCSKASTVAFIRRLCLSLQLLAVGLCGAARWCLYSQFHNG